MGVDLSIPAQSRALADLIGSRGLERPASAGHDIGGAIVILEAAFGQWRGQADYLRNLAQFDERHTAEFEPLLGSMRTPVRIIWGEEDAWLDPAFARRLHDLLPRSELVLLPGAGHFAMEDSPELVARAVNEFFGA
jgi:pimeloyl-ACP methyl ester carboxylesterase